MAEEPLQVSSLWAFDADLAEKIEEQEHKVGAAAVRQPSHGTRPLSVCPAAGAARALSCCLAKQCTTFGGHLVVDSHSTLCGRSMLIQTP